MRRKTVCESTSHGLMQRRGDICAPSRYKMLEVKKLFVKRPHRESFTPIYLLPFNRSRRFGSDVIDHAIDASDFRYDARRDGFE